MIPISFTRLQLSYYFLTNLLLLPAALIQKKALWCATGFRPTVITPSLFLQRRQHQFLRTFSSSKTTNSHKSSKKFRRRRGPFVNTNKLGSSSDDYNNNYNKMFWPDQQVKSGTAATADKDDAELDNDNNNSEDNEEAEEEAALSQVLDSILKVHCTHSEPDPILPWQRIAQSTSTSSGFVIDGRRIMTNAHSVEYGSMIQVQRRGQETKYQANILTFAPECDLALLTVTEDGFWDDDNGDADNTLQPLEFGPLPKLQDEVEVLGYPTGGESLSITQGVVSRIELQEYTQASAHLLAIQIDAAINAGNSGGPVVNQDLQVIGVAFQGLHDAQNIGYVVPVTVINHILQDVERNGQYTGFCSMGVNMAFLENKAFRKSLGMLPAAPESDKSGGAATATTASKSLSGVMIKNTVPTSPAKGIVLPNDVILEIDKIKVGNDGKIPFRRGERVSLSCYIHTKILGDMLRVKVLREGKSVELDVPVGISKRLVPTHWSNRPPPYLVAGGFVFTALSVPYLFASGAWDDYVSPNMSYLLSLLHRSLEREGDQIVILIQVLAHRENLGYDTLSDLQLERVNGQAVRSLQHLKTLIDECQDDFLRMEFSPDNRVAVLERSTLQDVTQEVCKEHSILKPFCLYDASDEGAIDDKKS